MNSAKSTDVPGVRVPQDAFDAFIARSAPEMLRPLLRQLQSIHVGVARLGVFMAAEDGARLGYWADSDGRVLRCPEELAPVTASVALSRLYSGVRKVVRCERDEAALWASDSQVLPVLALAVNRWGKSIGYLVVASELNRPLSRGAIDEIRAWGPMLSELFGHAVESSMRLVRAVCFAGQFTHARDPHTGEHQLRMGAFLHVLATEMAHAHGLSDGFVQELTLFGSLHDVGKVAVPDTILLKPGRFDAEEWAVMKSHVQKGSALIERMAEDLHLRDVPGLETLKNVVGCHHEYLDGSGYPEGRRGDEIPLAARMVTTADIFDALTHARPYKRGWQVDEALDHLTGLAGSQLDRECVSAFRSVRPYIERTLHHLNAVSE